jgi:hypothetical protein
MDEEREAPLDQLEAVDEFEDEDGLGDAAYTQGCNGTPAGKSNF